MVEKLSSVAAARHPPRYARPLVSGAGPGGAGDEFSSLGKIAHPADGGRGVGHRRQELAGDAKAEGKPIVHMVSARASANGLLLGPRKTDAKSNEIAAIPAISCAPWS